MAIKENFDNSETTPFGNSEFISTTATTTSVPMKCSPSPYSEEEYSIHEMMKILNDMINQQIITPNYFDQIFSNTEWTKSEYYETEETMGSNEETGKKDVLDVVVRDLSLSSFSDQHIEYKNCDLEPEYLDISYYLEKYPNNGIVFKNQSVEQGYINQFTPQVPESYYCDVYSHPYQNQSYINQCQNGNFQTFNSYYGNEGYNEYHSHTPQTDVFPNQYYSYQQTQLLNYPVDTKNYTQVPKVKCENLDTNYYTQLPEVKYENLNTDYKQPTETFSEKSFESNTENDLYCRSQCEWTGCKKVFSRQSSLVRHVETIHVKCKTKEFVCLWESCVRHSKTFSARYKLLTHTRIHTGDKPNKCDHPGCTKAFSTVENLKIHKRSHTGEKPCICKYPGCIKAYSNSSDCKKHYRTHINDRPFPCLISGCTKRYTDPSSLRKHKNKKHQDQ